MLLLLLSLLCIIVGCLYVYIVITHTYIANKFGGVLMKSNDLNCESIPLCELFSSSYLLAMNPVCAVSCFPDFITKIVQE